MTITSSSFDRFVTATSPSRYCHLTIWWPSRHRHLTISWPSHHRHLTSSWPSSQDDERENLNRILHAWTWKICVKTYIPWCYIIGAMKIQIHCTWITHQSLWGSGFRRVGCCVWASKIWRFSIAQAQMPYPTTLGSSDYNFGLKLRMCRFCIWQCNGRHMTILWTRNMYVQI